MEILSDLLAISPPSLFMPPLQWTRQKQKFCETLYASQRQNMAAI